MRELTPLLEQLKEVEYLGNASSGFTHFSIDSRVISDPKRACFVALPGPNHDGHDFINDAYAKGVRHFLLSQKPKNLFQDAAYYIVSNSLLALQQLAAVKRKRFHKPVIAITGSNGKTIVKEWVNLLLMEDLRIVRSPKSYNSQLGVALSLLLIKEQHEIALIEAGISQPGEMDALEGLIKPDAAVFTHLGSAHLEHFEDQKALAHEKAKLFRHAKVAFYPANNELIREALNEVGFKGKHFTWGKDGSELKLLEVHKSAHGADIRVSIEDETFQFQLSDSSESFLENALTALSVAWYYGKDHNRIIDEMQSLSTLNMRLERLEGWGGSKIISDVYSNDLPSLRIALDELSKIRAGRRVAFISDIPQSGMSDEALYKTVNRELIAAGVDEIITVGGQIGKATFSLPVRHFANTDLILSELDNIDLRDTAVLLKGARHFRFERITQALQQRAQESMLTIDLNNLTENLNFYRSQLEDETRIMVMIKAFGYGTGSVEIAELLEYHRVDYLGVAYVNEAIDLRKRGIQTPLFVLNPDIASFSQMIDHRIEPEVYSIRELQALIDELSRKQVDYHYPIHLKLDTGMHRLGFQEENLGEALDLIAQHSLHVKGVLSHLAASDDPSHDAFTREQISRFTAMADRVEETLGYKSIRHICNTAATMRFPEAHFGMVRLGIGVYGVNSCAEDEGKLCQVGSLKSKVSQVRNIPAGESVGYTRSDFADHPRVIATIPIGYADGYRRSLSNGKGYVSINGQHAPVVGKVCMDMIMVDATGIQVEEGDEVTIFGNDPTLQEMASAAGTIPYEILSGISQRVKRIYLS